LKKCPGALGRVAFVDVIPPTVGDASMTATLCPARAR
jgi:hypothetical protein